jgi:hypothetical protein
MSNQATASPSRTPLDETDNGTPLTLVALEAASAALACARVSMCTPRAIFPILVSLVAVEAASVPLVAKAHRARVYDVVRGHLYMSEGTSAPSNMLEIYPSRDMSPSSVVETQLQALQRGIGRLFWRFLSPEAKRSSGTIQHDQDSAATWLQAPNFREMPTFAPLVGALEYKFVGALSVGDNIYQCRVRVWPAGGDRECASGGVVPAAPVDYMWRLALQPLERPVCYEDDPMQQGISTGPPFSGCWLTDHVKLDERWGGGGSDEEPAPLPIGDGGLAVDECPTAYRGSSRELLGAPVK